MSSFGHYVRLLTEDEQQQLAKMRERYGPRFYACSQGRKPNRCEQPSTHMTGYRYVTGRAGRVSSAENHRCETHAQAFAKKHKLEMPSEPSARPRRTGGDIVADVIQTVTVDGITGPIPVDIVVPPPMTAPRGGIHFGKENSDA